MEKIKCNECNKEILSGIRFCPFCGSEQKVKKSSTTYDKNPFEILQVTPYAEEEVIRAAYKSLAKKYHPDTLKNGTSDDRMKELNWAYSELSNPETRKEWASEERSTFKQPKAPKTEPTPIPKEKQEEPKVKYDKPPVKPKQTSTTSKPLSQSANEAKKKNKGVIILGAIAIVIICLVFLLSIIEISSREPNSSNIASNPIRSTPTKHVAPSRTPTPSQNWRIVINEQFNNNQIDWATKAKSEEGTGKDQSEIKNGKLVWTGEADAERGFTAHRIPDGGLIFGNFKLSVDVEKVEGNNNSYVYGVTFRGQNSFDYYLFLLFNTNYSFVVIQGDEPKIIESKEASIINPNGKNNITVEAIGSIFTFFVNDKLLAEFNDINIRSPGGIGLVFGLYAGEEATVEFDNLKIWVPGDSKTLNTISTKTPKIESIDLCEKNQQNSYCVYAMGTNNLNPQITLKYTSPASPDVYLIVNGDEFNCFTEEEYPGNLYCWGVWGEELPNPIKASVSVISVKNNYVIAQGIFNLPSTK